MPVADLWTALSTRPGGLSDGEAAARRSAALRPRRKPTALVVAEELVESLVEPLQLLLIAVGVLSAIFGEVRDAVAIFAIITLVAAVEAISEARAKRSLRALRDLSARSALVRRDGHVRGLPPEALVTGDILVIEAGDVIAADARVIAADALAVDESALTGEPVSAAKGTDPVLVDAPLAERSSMLFAGTAAVAGSGEAIVTAVGAETETGRLGKLVSETREPATPLQRAMAELARAALFIALAASVIVPLIGLLRGQPARQMLLDGLTLAFATIPEELPILVTVLVAVGGLRLARRGVLLRRLRAAEAVGGVSVLVTDKTGTLTCNRLALDTVAGPREQTLAVARAALGSGAARDPVDAAIAEADPGDSAASVAVRFPFDPSRKRESAVALHGDELRVSVKGAPEAVVAASRLTEEDRGQWLRRAEHLADAGLRVLAVGERIVDHPPEEVTDAERDLDIVGLLAFRDPLRPGVPDAVRTLRDAGVRTIVVSGDHPKTVAAIAAEAGLDSTGVILGGHHLARLDDAELTERLTRELAIARATPEDKLRIVRLLQASGDAVAVTGDGVNDAPALAAADVGIAMGARGTDLAREAADLVITDDAYPTVVDAVAGGRGLTAQLRRAVAFYLGAKIALVTVVGVPLALGMASPLEPVHIVLLELFMDLGASVAFVAEPPAADVLRRPPRDPARRFLDRGQLAAIGLTALALTAAVLPAFLVVRAAAGPAAGTAAAVATWLVAHSAVAWTLRSHPRLGWRRNAAFPLWALAAVLTAAVLAFTPIAATIGSETLDLQALVTTLGASVVALAVAIAGRRALSIPREL